jgi:DUF971 family protein
MRPLRISRESEAALVIEWDDHHKGRHLLTTLRSACPCASCKTGEGEPAGMIMLPVFTPGRDELTGIEPVGAYALQLLWKDGHRTGIYSFDYLRQLCECDECRKNQTR